MILRITFIGGESLTYAGDAAELRDIVRKISMTDNGFVEIRGVRVIRRQSIAYMDLIEKAEPEEPMYSAKPKLDLPPRYENGDPHSPWKNRVD